MCIITGFTNLKENISNLREYVHSNILDDETRIFF